jgi:lipoprotein-anchoring transpeptidase ErfK/SrfK
VPAVSLCRPAAPLICALAALGAAASAHAATPTAPGLAHPALPGRLSDERTLTRYATAIDRAPVRRRPAPAAKAVARLRYFTEDQLPEVYVALEQARGADGRAWVRVRVPMRPNGTTGWVPRRSLNDWHVSTKFLWVGRRTHRALLFNRGRVVWRSRVGVGKRATPTPAGRFYVRERIRNLGGAGIYGPIAFGTSAYSRLSDWPGGGVIGIHGTNEPRLIPGAISHGCVRVPNRAVLRLARLLEIGTPVLITDRRRP